MSTREIRRLLAFGVALLAAGVALPRAETTAAAATARTWYVDCNAAPDGTGTRAKPFATLDAANAVTLGPGDALRLRRGTVCTGMLSPTGSGAAGRPILIGTYGSATARPRIDAGGTEEAAVALSDQSYVTVEGLELTNAGDPTGEHRGVYFTSNKTVVRGITLQKLIVHDVDSIKSMNDGKAGGGIVGWVLSARARFAGITIQDNDVRDVSRQGITVYGTGSVVRPPATASWAAASTGVVIRRNLVDKVQGDGILPMGTVDALVEHNIVRRGNLAGFDHESDDRNCAVGIWAFNANRTVIQHNEVSNMHFGPSIKPGALNGCDGEAFDIDYGQDGTIIQYNYSHNNDGGFVHLCTTSGTVASEPHRGDVRFNLSVDDNSTLNPVRCQANARPAVNNLSGLRMYNNTIVAKTPRTTLQLDESLAASMPPYFGNFEFQNNVIYATATGAGSHRFDCGNSCVTNLFFRRPPPDTAERSVATDPRFTNPARRGTGFAVADAFRVRAASPAIKAGSTVPAGVPTPASTNFFGEAITTPPNIGFD